MRHRKIGRNLNRKRSHLKLMLSNMSNSLLTYGSIKTTLAKAKELKRFIEPLISISKNYSISNRRLIFSKIRNKNNVAKLFNKVGPSFLNKNGGYTRIIKAGFRKGDNAYMAYITLLESKLINKQKNIQNIKDPGE